jgi:hypothetical protein
MVCVFLNDDDIFAHVGMSILGRLEEILKDHIKLRKHEKDAHGEVFTPPIILETMLNQFPKEIWSNPNATWLDPAAGIGNFPIALYLRLMEGLKGVMPNERRRAEHIVKKMLYMVEFNPENAKKSVELFGKLCPSVAPNLYVGDFFDVCSSSGVAVLNWPKRFDCVIGNPPYNSGGTKRNGEKRIHIAFAAASLDCILPKGYLSFICPPNYREAGNKMNLLFRNRKGHFVAVHVYDADETHRHFKIQARVDAFLFQLDLEGTTQFVDAYGHKGCISLNLQHHVPNFGHSIFSKLLKKVAEFGCIQGYRMTEMTTVRKGAFEKGGHKILHLLITGGRRTFMVKRKHSLEGIPKAYINGLGLPYVYYDADGSYGCTQTPVIVREPSKQVVELLQSPLFQCIAWGLRFTGNNNMPYLLDYIPAVNSSVGSLKTMTDIQRWLGLIDDEVAFLLAEFPALNSADMDLIEPIE